ncbi:hypothetical protein [Modestobacter roseus]|uniref:Uncharacterized protein n=1 Tax=Modestobacter roseus TaxID=1181884 RepID=A0A562IRP9_9ACTN|nr:hypothetical protein [Modestobacter roseus]MQA32076.1 hypothetical protein [Modestobacter roseus]TWH73393.1 hypothetical protein JD78_01916 [Modestobacter roseus]
MTTDSRPIVASGKPYPVISPPDSLEAFLGDAEFTLDGTGGPLAVRGHGVPLDGDTVRFHEKAVLGGKDVRVWHVRRQGEGFTAEHVAAF